MVRPVQYRGSLTPSKVTWYWRPHCWLTAERVQDVEYGPRSLPPALEQFCEGSLPSIAQRENKRILSALFVPSL